MVYTNIIYITLSYKYTPYIEVAYTNYLAGSLNIYVGKTPVPNSNTPSSYLSADGKPYYNNNLFLNKSINPTSIGL